MTKEDIIRMAREAGFVRPEVGATELQRFAALVAAHEREACAKICEETGWNQGKMYAKDIRARGQA